MRDERKKQARSNKQTRQSNTAHPRQSLVHVHAQHTCIYYTQHTQEITLTEALNDAAVLAGGNVRNPSSPTPPPRPPFTLTPSEQRPQQHVDGGSGPTVDRELELALALSRQQVLVL